jgi:hypothetical protein
VKRHSEITLHLSENVDRPKGAQHHSVTVSFESNNQNGMPRDKGWRGRVDLSDGTGGVAER